MLNAIDFIGLLKHLPAYLRLRTAQEAVCLPLLISLILWHIPPRKRLPAGHALVFIFGTLISAVFSIHRYADGIETLCFIPGYALIVQLLPRTYQPSWNRAFGLSFLSVLFTDIWCSAVPHLKTGALPNNFYNGIGGAGFGDLLFLSPWLAAVPLFVSDTLFRGGIANMSLSDCFKLLKNRQNTGVE